MWPLLLALFVGVSLGFAGGYGFGIRDRPETNGQAAQAGQVGRTITDGAVVDTPKPLATVAVAPSVAKPTPPMLPAAATTTLPVAKTKAPPAAKAKLLGSLSIVSRPAGAKVFIDGRAAGTTPLSVASIGAGRHAIRIEHAGYRAWSSAVTVAATKRARITALLGK